MEPTIYKPSIYKNPTVYKGGAGIAYEGTDFPSESAGKEGDKAIVMAAINTWGNGTIIPIQADNSNCFGSSTEIYKAFDGNTSTGVSMSSGYPCEFGFDFGEGNEKKICSVGVYYYNTTIFFRVRASNNRKDWHTLAFADCRLGMTGTCSVTFNNDNYYRYYSVIVYSANGNSIDVREIYMNDDTSVIKEPNTAQLFIKEFGIWNYAGRCTGFDCVPAVVYRRNTKNPGSSLNKFVGTLSTNLYIEFVGVIDSDLFLENSSAFIGWDNNAQIPFKFIVSTSGANISFSMVINNSSYSTITISKDTFLSHREFKVISDKDSWSIYLDNTLFGSDTISGWNELTGQNWSSICNVFGGRYNQAYSSQLGLKSLLIIDNYDGHLVCDIVSAKMMSSNTLGYFDKNFGWYYPIDISYVGEITT